MNTKALTLFAIMSASACSLAQKQDDFDFYFSDIGIIQAKPVQAEIALTAAQREAMNRHAEWLNAIRTNLIKQVQAKSLEQAEADKRMASALGEMKGKILGELTAPQLRRVREIVLQRDGFLPLLDQKMADKIGMTAAQLKTLRDAFVANDKSAKQVQRQAFEPIMKKYDAMRPKSKEEETKLKSQAEKELSAAKDKIAPDLIKLGKDYEDLITKTLTKGQMQAFIALKGKPFKPAG